MRPDIHPEWHSQAQVICGCGNTWTTGATVPVIRTDVCSDCHPFFTGEQRIVDTAGQVERFMRRLEKRDEKAAATTKTTRGGNGAAMKGGRARPEARKKPSAPSAASGAEAPAKSGDGDGEAPTGPEKD